MPKIVPLAELEVIEKVVSQRPSGIKLEELLEERGIKLPRRTLQRRLNLLIKQGRVIASGKGVNHKYYPSPATVSTYGGFHIPLSNESSSIRDYINQPLEKRRPVKYNKQFLYAYRPNETYYLSLPIREHLRTIGSHPTLERIAGTYARTILDSFLLDLTWNSSRLEGNTYSLLETTRLILGEKSDNRNTTETQMILNHKAAIDFLVESAEDIAYDRSTILNLHALLSDNLLSNPAACGRLRSIPVAIAKTVYSPLEIAQLIDECFQQVLSTCCKIKDPFEQAFFISVHLPYLQPFEDVNKRVSRLACNIPLIKNNLSPLSFIDVPEEAYIEGLLGIYELNQVDLFRDVFLWAYERSSARYTTVQQKLGEPDPFKLKYRQQRIAVVKEVVNRCLNAQESTNYIQAWTDSNIQEVDRARFREMIETELLNLHPGNIARFQLKASEFEKWRSVMRTLEIYTMWRTPSFNEHELNDWISTLEEKKQSGSIVYWFYTDIQNFFCLKDDEFKEIIRKAEEHLQVRCFLSKDNHFSFGLTSRRLTRHACFSIANILETEKGYTDFSITNIPEIDRNTLERDKSLFKKAEFAQYYFGGWPCGLESLKNRIQEGRLPGYGKILCALGNDSGGFVFK